MSIVNSIYSSVHQLFTRKNGHTPYYGFQNGDDHWSKNTCGGSGQPLGSIDAGRGFCSVCRKKKLKATLSGRAWPHKATIVR